MVVVVVVSVNCVLSEESIGDCSVNRGCLVDLYTVSFCREANRFQAREELVGIERPIFKVGTSEM